jgi:glyoxylase-like metal-dependent hydrolase (beta-lactamase superfamily II)
MFTEAEAALHAQVAADLPDAPPARVDHELSDGQLLDELRIRVLATPGHTDGSVALLAADAGVMFTGDIAAEQDGAVILGPFNTDRSQARSSFRRLASLQSDLDVVPARCRAGGTPARPSR